MIWLLVPVAGGVGAVCRFLLDGFIQSWHRWPVPVGTLVVNTIGSLLLGLLTGYAAAGGSADLALIIGTGFCGGFTTFSTASVECLRLAHAHRSQTAVAYATGTLLAALAAAFLGLWLAGW